MKSKSDSATPSTATPHHTVTSRREFLGRSMVGLAVISVGGLAAACGGSEPEAPALDCSEPANLTDAQRTTRTNAAYVDQTTDASKACVLCNFYTSGAAGQCGSCTLGMGSVNPAGTCNSFAARAS